MQFIPISIDDYVKKHLKNYPSEKEKGLRQRLKSALEAYKKESNVLVEMTYW